MTVTSSIQNTSDSSDALSDREAELLRVIAADLAGNQRDLSQHMQLSLGMTNLLIRRLVEKGFVQLDPVNKRKVRYVLTPKGQMERSRRSMENAVRTIEVIGRVRSRLREILAGHYAGGQRHFFLVGESALVPIVEQIFREPELRGCVLRKEGEVSPEEGLILTCAPSAEALAAGQRVVDLIAEIAKSEEGELCGI